MNYEQVACDYILFFSIEVFIIKSISIKTYYTDYHKILKKNGRSNHMFIIVMMVVIRIGRGCAFSVY
jgi:hypothetical protein